MTADEARVHRNVKNSIFMDLFGTPKYQLQLFQALHPEMTDVAESDIKILTLNCVIFDGIYNDLGLLVRDKLLILVEAQSTWSINILVRILMYLASTYHDYITSEKLSVYGSKKLEIPEPEFCVIYTGSKKVKDTISLREDFWGNPNAKINLVAKVIHAENQSDIMGQYIIFCHVFDEQRKIHGLTKPAIENTISICQDRGVLKNYLETKKKEVSNIMFLLFDQGYNTEVYGREMRQEGIEEGIGIGIKKGELKGTVATCQQFGKSLAEAINIVAENFGLTKNVAAGYVREFWKN